MTTTELGQELARCSLQKCGWADFLILERRAGLGGTWDFFRYPGIRSDSDSMHSLYCTQTIFYLHATPLLIQTFHSFILHEFDPFSNVLYTTMFQCTPLDSPGRFGSRQHRSQQRTRSWLTYRYSREMSSLLN